jgi:membrane dipeptidase
MCESKEQTNLKENNFHVDLNKLKKANSIAQFFALFVDINDAKKKGEEPFQKFLKMADRFYKEIENNTDEIEIAKNYRDMQQNIKNGKISAFLTIEGGGALQGSLSNLRNAYRLGVRLITLTWNYPNEIAFPNWDETYSNEGLTPLGKEIIKEMNRLGMIIDVSHLSDQGFYDVARLSSKPFVASHSDARAMQYHARNLSDDMIKVLAEKGGVMGINFCIPFLGDVKVSRVEDMVRHIKHIKNVGGIDVVSMGTDFDGIGGKLEISNIGEMDKLLSALEKDGFTQDEIEKMFYKNTERVIKEVLK